MPVTVRTSQYRHDFVMHVRVPFVAAPSATNMMLFVADRTCIIDAPELVIGRSTTTPGGDGLSNVGIYKIKPASTGLTDTTYPMFNATFGSPTRASAALTLNEAVLAAKDQAILSAKAAGASAAAIALITFGWFRPSPLAVITANDADGVPSNMLKRGEIMVINIDSTGTFTGYIGPVVTFRMRSRLN